MPRLVRLSNGYYCIKRGWWIFSQYKIGGSNYWQGKYWDGQMPAGSMMEKEIAESIFAIYLAETNIKEIEED